MGIQLDDAAQLEFAFPKGKLGLIVRRLLEPHGATLAELIEITGWRPHSVRGKLAGVIAKQLRLPIRRETVDGAHRYLVTLKGDRPKALTPPSVKRGGRYIWRLEREGRTRLLRVKVPQTRLALGMIGSRALNRRAELSAKIQRAKMHVHLVTTSDR